MIRPRGLALFLSVLPVVALAQKEETEIGNVHWSKQPAVSYQKEVFSRNQSAQAEREWIALRSGDLRAAFTPQYDAYRISLSTTVGRLLHIDKVEALDFFNHLQLEVHTESFRPAYGVLGFEGPIGGGVNIYVAAVANSEEYRQVIGGGIFYWDGGHTQVLFYPRAEGQPEGDVKSEGAVAVRNRAKKGPVGVDFDFSYKKALVEDKPRDVVGLGFGASLGPVFARYQYQPLWESSRFTRDFVEVGYNYAM
jgi:hypothetical protein